MSQENKKLIDQILNSQVSTMVRIGGGDMARSYTERQVRTMLEEYATQRIELSTDRFLNRQWLELSTEEKSILGRPNFSCGWIAKKLREKGHECANKAEEEQALVIYTMLQFFYTHGSEWADKMDEYLKNPE